MEDPLRRALLVFALQNAVKHQSIPKAGTVIGMVMVSGTLMLGRGLRLAGATLGPWASVSGR